jgi:small subunit ribosomal protein S17
MSENGNEKGQSETSGEAHLAGGRNRRKMRVGVVVSDKANKTIIVQVERRLSHPLYGKSVARTQRYHVHDEKNEYKVGDTVRITETRPLSKLKRWRVVGLVERAV